MSASHTTSAWHVHILGNTCSTKKVHEQIPPHTLSALSVLALKLLRFFGALVVRSHMRIMFWWCLCQIIFVTLVLSLPPCGRSQYFSCFIFVFFLDCTFFLSWRSWSAISPFVVVAVLPCQMPIYLCSFWFVGLIGLVNTMVLVVAVWLLDCTCRKSKASERSTITGVSTLRRKCQIRWEGHVFSWDVRDVPHTCQLSMLYCPIWGVVRGVNKGSLWFSVLFFNQSFVPFFCPKNTDVEALSVVIIYF